MEKTVVAHGEWVEARKALLAKEKEFTRLRDELSQERRKLPWEKVQENYDFDGPNGPVKLGLQCDPRTGDDGWRHLQHGGHEDNSCD